VSWRPFQARWRDTDLQTDRNTGPTTLKHRLFAVSEALHSGVKGVVERNSKFRWSIHSKIQRPLQRNLFHIALTITSGVGLVNALRNERTKVEAWKRHSAHEELIFLTVGILLCPRHDGLRGLIICLAKSERSKNGIRLTDGDRVGIGADCEGGV
jgi:hypothetical protein